MPKKQGKIIIAGTGRSGTTFLMLLLTRLGFDTGFAPWDEGISTENPEGLELKIHELDSVFEENPQAVREIFDGLPRVIKIGAPDDNVRHDFLKEKLPAKEKKNLKKWQEATKGLSFAALAETIISVYCLGNDFKKTVKTLFDLERGNPSSEDYEEFGTKGNLGFSQKPDSGDGDTPDEPDI